MFSRFSKEDMPAMPLSGLLQKYIHSPDWASKVPMQAWISALLPLALLSCTSAEKLDLSRLKLPAGFHIVVFAEAPHARQMAFSPGGVLLVTDMSDGAVLGFPDL